MKIYIEHTGTVFEYEHKPMPESRFKALCGLAAAGIYAGMVYGVVATCGVFGLLLVVIGTLFSLVVVKGP